MYRQVDRKLDRKIDNILLSLFFCVDIANDFIVGYFSGFTLAANKPPPPPFLPLNFFFTPFISHLLRRVVIVLSLSGDF